MNIIIAKQIMLIAKQIMLIANLIIIIYNRQIKKFPTEKQNVSLKHILT